MVDRMHFVTVGKYPGGFIQHQRVVFPAVPEVTDHLHELFGLGVAVMGRRVFIKTKIGRGGSH